MWRKARSPTLPIKRPPIVGQALDGVGKGTGTLHECDVLVGPRNINSSSTQAHATKGGEQRNSDGDFYESCTGQEQTHHRTTTLNAKTFALPDTLKKHEWWFLPAPVWTTDVTQSPPSAASSPYEHPPTAPLKVLHGSRGVRVNEGQPMGCLNLRRKGHVRCTRVSTTPVGGRE